MQEVMDELIPAAFEEAAAAAALEPVNEPRYQVKEATPAGPLAFTAEFAHFPEIKLPDYSKYVLKRDVAPVTEQDVDESLQALREINARLEPSSRPLSGTGDLVIVRFLEPKPPEGFSQQTVGIWAGEAEDEVFGRQVLGKAVGDRFALEVAYPADYPEKKFAGKKVHAPAEVAEVKQRILPMLDNDFAKDLGEDSLEALTDKVKRRLAARAVEMSYVNAYYRLLDDVVAHAKVPLAESFVAEFVAAEEEGGEPLSDKKKEELKAGARKELERYFVVRALARKENVTVSAEEVRAVMAAEAQGGRQPQRPATVYDRLLNEKLARRLVPREEPPPAAAAEEHEHER
jgi:trigger factor